MVAPETTTAGALSKYRLIAELGHGGMAEVFLALASGPAGFNKLVVLKQIREQLAEDPEFLGMFLDEARLAARLNHPNVVQTNEVGHENGRTFIAMEYLEGQPLNRIVQRLGKAGQLSLAMHVQVLIDALTGLHYAHDLADFDGTPLMVVHRDATPHNVFVTYTGQVKVVDFGIAKVFGATSETRTGVLKGKVSYMAPEQAMGERVDRRADVFSAGMMLWEALAGTRLFRGQSDVVVLQRIGAGDIPSPRTVRPDIPAELEAICMKALSHDREDRHASARELQHALEQALVHMGERPLLRDLGEALAAHFAADRMKIKGLVEAQIQSLRAAAATDDEAGAEAFTARLLAGGKLPRIDAPHTEGGSLPGSHSGASNPSARVSRVSLVGPSSSLTAANVPPELASAAGRGRMAAIVAGTVMLGALLAFAVLRGVAPPREASGRDGATTETTAAPGKVGRTLRIDSTPPGATVTENDKPLGKTPMVIALDPATTATRQLILTLDGYTPTTISQPPSSEDVRIVIPLAPAPVNVTTADPGDAARLKAPRAPVSPPPGKLASPPVAPAKTPPPGLDINMAR